MSRAAAAAGLYDTAGRGTARPVPGWCACPAAAAIGKGMPGAADSLAEGAGLGEEPGREEGPLSWVIERAEASSCEGLVGGAGAVGC